MEATSTNYVARLKEKIGEWSIIDRGFIYCMEKNAPDAEVAVYYNGDLISAFPRTYKLSDIEFGVIDRERICNEICKEALGTETSKRDLSEFERKINPVLEQLISKHDVLPKTTKSEKNVEDILVSQPKPSFKGKMRNGADSIFASVYPSSSYVLYRETAHTIILERNKAPTENLCVKLADKDESGKTFDENFYKTRPEGEKLGDFLAKYANALAQYERWVFSRAEENKNYLNNELIAKSESLASKLASQQSYNAHGIFIFEKFPSQNFCKLYKNLEPFAWDISKIKHSDMPNYLIWPACKAVILVKLDNGRLTATPQVEGLTTPHPFISGSNECTGLNDRPSIPENDPREAAKILYNKYLTLVRDLLIGHFNVSNRPAVYNHLAGIYNSVEHSDEKPANITPSPFTEDYRYLL